MELQQQIKSNIVKDFDRKLQFELDTCLYSFIANVKLDEGESFHDAVDAVYDREGAKGLREFLEGLINMLKDLEKN